MFYIVSTPIGNLKDITLRALEVLREVDLIAAEDTRRSRKLLAHYGIHTPITSYFEHNKLTKSKRLVSCLQDGKSVALISDSGTPGISDPGFYIIRMAIEHNIQVTIIPGPCALISALVISGKPTDRFIFEGFLPAKQTARKKRLQTFINDKRTVVIYESPYRIIKTLNDIGEIFKEQEIVVIREITKKFEEVKRGTADKLAEHFTENNPRGEFVIVL